MNKFKVINTPISDKQYTKNRENGFYVAYPKTGEVYQEAQRLINEGYKTVKVYYVRTSVKGYYDTIIMYRKFK